MGLYRRVSAIPGGMNPYTAGVLGSLLTTWVTEIAVADSRGAVVKVNRKWKETARHGDLSVKPGGWNYIAEWEAAIGRGVPARRPISFKACATFCAASCRRFSELFLPFRWAPSLVSDRGCAA